MFGLGTFELVVVGIVALIVIGPKDLPVLFRRMGEMTGKARRMAREFSRAMDQAADDAGLKDVQNTMRAAANPTGYAKDKVKEAAGMKGPATQALSAERQAHKEKLSKAMADAATARHAREAEEAAAAEAQSAPAETAPKEAAAPETETPEAKS